mgnify:CR=1 FL=1
MNYKAESLNRLDFPLKFGDRPCRIYGTDCAEYLLLQMTDEHELQHMDNEISAIAQGSAHSFLFAAVPVKNWNDELSPWKSPAVWGKESFGGNAAGTLRFLTEQAIPTLKQQFALPENVRIILGGYSLAGHPRRQLCFPVLRPLRLLCGFRDGWSLNSGTRYRRSTFI